LNWFIKFNETYQLHAIGGRPDSEFFSFPKLDNNSMANERIYKARVTLVPAADIEVVYPGMRFEEGLSQNYHSRYHLAIHTVMDL